jgi:hypothetical protein
LKIEMTCAQCGHRRTIDAASPRLRDRKVAGARASSAERDVTKYSRSAKKDVKSAMRRRKKGTLKSGKGGKGGTVKSRKQAIAIGLSEARKKSKKVPKRRTSGKKSSK